jgi:pyruvate formate lyase activating enzyme
MNTATVFNVQRFSVHDGPGIRSTVFLKGCPLHCPWCHNPEGIDPRPEVSVQGARCLACDRCVPVCDAGLTGRVDGAAEGHRPDATCLRCGACAAACPTGSRELVGRTMTVTGLVAELERDRPYYAESGGGVTFSGGEPAAAHHAPFLLDCLDLLGRFGIHRAVDTCGHVPAATMLAVAGRADLILYDLKIMDADRHRELLGVDNALILANLERLTTAGHEVLVRMPLVPGLTDDQANLESAAEFVAALHLPCPVELLPFHGLAGDKYGRLGRGNELAGTAVPPAAAVLAAAEPFTARGLDVRGLDAVAGG